MGCTFSNEGKNSSEEEDYFLEEKEINDAIEQSLRIKRNNEKNQISLLLLGAGESGKSTVLKQMKLLHKGGFSQQERRQYAQVIWVDIVQSMKILIVQARKLGIQLECDNSSSGLAGYKHIVMKANALEQVDAGVAGGTNFLNDYVLRYSQANHTQRKLKSTGIASGAKWDEEDMNEKQADKGGIADVEIENISHALSEVNSFSPGRTSMNTFEVSRINIAKAIDKLWKNDSGIQRCFDRSNEFQLESSTQYYFDNIFNFADEDYICSDLDILKGRIKTTGITETTFNINSFKFKVLDAGGQRSERKKWIHCFDNITAVLFVLAISEYDQMLFEDERVNRMHESILLFDSLCNSKWFRDTPFILFMNKMDIFEEKLQKSPLKKYFPDYNGKPNDVDAAARYFENILLNINATKKPIYVHRTCATDTQSMKFVLTAVTDLIVQQNLIKSGII